MKNMNAPSTKTAHRSGFKVFGILLMALCLSEIWASPSLAQAPPITPSGLNTQVNLSATPPAGKTQYDITGGTRPGGGTNLFHSFGNFNVPNNNIANFLNETALPTSNILGRVTGGNISNIFGTIQTTNFGNANLFLMNPAGIVFGPNAALNVGGSVSFTTADYLRLADGGRFTAIPGSQDASISSAPVAAFGFLGSNPGVISVQGSQLSVTPGQSISLVGGNITVQPDMLDDGITIQPAHLSAPGGQINLASVASPGEILTGALGQAQNISGQSFGNLGTIQISEQSVIDVSGNGGGTVLIRGGQLVLDNSTISANVTGPGPVINGSESTGHGIDIEVSQDAVIRNAAVLETNVLSNVTPGVTYGDVKVKADHIEIDGMDLPAFIFTGIRSNVGTDEQPTINGGNSGNINLDANSILIKGGGGLETRLVGSSPVAPVPGNAGDITVTADQDIQLNNSSISSNILFGSGTGGNITLTSRHGSVLESGMGLPPNFVPTPGQPFPSTTFNIMFNQAVGPGNTGNITLNAPEGEIRLAGAVIQLGIPPGGTGTAGAFQANANNMQLINFSTIQMDNFSPKPAGSFNVALNGNLTLNSSRIITTARGPAQAADLNITAHDVLVTQGSSLSTETQSAGNAGHLNISAETLEITNGGRISSGSAQAAAPPAFLNLPPPPPPTGAGGSVTVQGLASPADSVLIDGVGSGIFTNTVGTGAAGNTNIATRSLTMQNGGTISAATSGIESSATGGNIAISAGQAVSMSNSASVSASSTGPADAGNIAINAGAQFLSQNASVTTEASQASGGNILIQATDSIRLINSQINTSVQGGPNTSGGNITIDPAIMTLQNSQILAQAVQGQGGNINIVAGTFLADQTSIVNASSQFGLSGTVNIQSPVSSLSGSLATLPQRPLQVQHLLQQRCAAQANGQLSSLVVAGRDTLPSEPGSWLMSPLALISDDAPVQELSTQTGSSGEPLQRKLVLSGQLVDQPGPSPQQGVTTWAAGCGS